MLLPVNNSGTVDQEIFYFWEVEKTFTDRRLLKIQNENRFELLDQTTKQSKDGQFNAKIQITAVDFKLGPSCPRENQL